jgi:hypothetical protein
LIHNSTATINNKGDNTINTEKANKKSIALLIKLLYIVLITL